MSEIELPNIAAEIEDLLGFVTFGQDRLEELSQQLKQLDLEAKKLSSRLTAAKLITKTALVRSTLQTTRQSIEEWEQRSLSYVRQIEKWIAQLEIAQQPIKRQIRQLETNIKLLLKRIAVQKHTLDVLYPQVENLQDLISQRYVELLREKK